MDKSTYIPFHQFVILTYNPYFPKFQSQYLQLSIQNASTSSNIIYKTPLYTLSKNESMS